MDNPSTPNESPFHSYDTTSEKVYRPAVGKTLAGLTLEDDNLCLLFTDGTGIALFDSGQSCCEQRYMTTDDILDYYVGSILQRVEVRTAGHETNDDYDVHDIQFLLVTTDRGTFTMESHNVHNGYYGGFDISCREYERPVTAPVQPLQRHPEVGHGEEE